MAKSAGIVGEIVHAAGARYRVRGEGLLRTRMKNLEETRTVTLEPVSMTTPSSREKTILANFQDQGLQIFFRTIHIDETFNMSKSICFVKPVAESYPIKSGG